MILQFVDKTPALNFFLTSIIGIEGWNSNSHSTKTHALIYTECSCCIFNSKYPHSLQALKTRRREQQNCKLANLVNY